MTSSLKYNPLLWSQLRPSARPPASDSCPPLVPENKTNTSLRVVLHDTKSALEQFSERLGTLVAGVEQAKRDIDTVNSGFAEGHERVLEELNTTVNRSQKGLLEIIGSPAQAIVLEEVKSSQADTLRKLTLLEDKAELVQRQLHTISEQQGHILTALAAITPLSPLLKDSPQQHAQILSMLTSLLPVLSLLQSLPTQVKASQEQALHSVTTSIAEMARSCKEACVSRAARTREHSPLASKCTLSSDPSHSSFSVNAQVQQPGAKLSLSSASESLLTVPSSDESDVSRERKRQRTLDMDTQMPPYRTGPPDPVTPRTALGRRNSSRPASAAPTSTFRTPAVPSRVQSTGDAAPPVPDRITPSGPRLKRSITLGRVPMMSTYFPPTTPPFARRGVLANVYTPAAAAAVHDVAETPSRSNSSHYEASSTHAGRPLIRRNSQQRKLLNEDADEDVDIDLDWGEMASS